MSNDHTKEILMTLGRMEGSFEGFEKKLDQHIVDTKDALEKQVERDTKQDEKIRSLEDSRLKVVSGAGVVGGLVGWFSGMFQ